MFVGIPLQPSHQLCISNLSAHIHRSKIKGMTNLSNHPLSSHASCQDHWSWSVSSQINRPLYHIPQKYKAFTCRSFALPGTNQLPNIKSAVLTLSRSFNVLHGRHLLLQLFPALGAIAFAIWGLEPLMRHSRNLFLPHPNDSNWKKSITYRVSISYLKPMIFWGGAIFACRVFDQVSLTSETSRVVKQRVLHFVRSLSTVLAFSYCLSSLIQHMQKFLEDTNGSSSDTRNMGFQFAGKALYTSVWVAAVSLFMELLGFSTQKWLTAGGLGTVLLTLAGREIFTNFLSSIMIHATRPFVSNEWIQTKIEGYEVSGTVEEVGWWSPTIIRGEDREAIHIPNHKFTVNVVRNLTQKTHWRVKTHFAISHLDAIKISSIVADMRKVMAKNPQVEQQRLHRRIFLEYINPENQAFMILISCFVKTSHYEEYLCVKEAILLDLLRVITHHRARLATPIRTVQKMYGDVDLENAPFADTIFTHDRRPVRSPLYLIDSTSRFNGDEKTKKRASPIVNMEPLKTTVVASDKKSTNPASEGEASPSNRKFNQELSSEEPLQNNTEGKQSGKKNSKSRDNQTKGSTTPNSKGTAASVASEKKKPSSDQKNESEILGGVSQATKRPNLEENIILGVALDGSKRTLPIDEEIEARELAPIQNKDKKDGPKTNEKPNDSQTV